MTLHERIQNEIKSAMKERNETKLLALRGLLSAMTNELVALGQKPSEILSDENAEKVIKRQVKQRNESIAQFKNAGRNDLVLNEEKELAYFTEYLPKEMGDDELKKIVAEKIKELGATDKSKIGILVGSVLKATGGKANGARVKELIEESFG